MNDLNQEHIVRFITAFRRMKRTGEEHYVMFEWANGGNLRNLWESTPSPTLTGNLVKLVVCQVYGLAAALSAAHNLEGNVLRGASYRHGDLKPENILVFKDDSPIGKLKIGDWGEAKFHGLITAIRPSRTTTKFGTRRYEAPEVDTGVRVASLGQSTQRRSRLCDIWAMGCVTLEFIVWLMYGKKGLDQFNHDVSGETFYTISWENGIKVAQVHSQALAWMDRMAEQPICEVGVTAIGDLLEIVRSSLLVVRLPAQLGSEFVGTDTDQNRADSVHDPDRSGVGGWLQSPSDRHETRSIFEEEEAEEEAVTDAPAIVITPAAPPMVESNRMPIQPKLEKPGKKRCGARTFKDSMYTLATEDNPTYWEVNQQQLETPMDLTNVDPSSPNTQVVSSPDEFRKVSYTSLYLRT